MAIVLLVAAFASLESRLQNYKSSFSLQLMKTNFDSIAIDSLERFGLIIRPALLNARSLAAELAGAVNNVRANGRKARNRFSLKTLIPWPPTSSEENNANCWSTSADVICLGDWELVLGADDDMNVNSLALFDTVGVHWLSIFDGDATACADDLH